MKLAWCTDTHLDHIVDWEVKEFASQIEADAVLFTGDISCADYLVGHLSKIHDIVGKPVYVVLGNHDFYGSDVASVREKVSNLEGVHYLSVMKPVELAPETALVGHDGWYDLYYGNGTSTSVILNDFRHIKDFLPFFYQGAVEIPARELAREAAAHVSKQIDAAAKKYSRIIVATHVPPWPQASTYRGKQSDNDFLPLFCSKLMELFWIRLQRIIQVLNSRSLRVTHMGIMIHSFIPTCGVSLVELSMANRRFRQCWRLNE